MIKSKGTLRSSRKLLKAPERRWVLRRLREIVDFYRTQILQGEVPRSDLGYLSIFFRLASDKLSIKDLKRISHAVRDLSAQVILQKKDFTNTHILLNPWSNLIALKIWEELGEPTGVGNNLSLRMPKTTDQALFIGSSGYGLAGAILDQKKAVQGCKTRLKENLRTIHEYWGYQSSQSDKSLIFDLGLAHGDAGILAFSSYMKIQSIADKLALSFCNLSYLLGNRPFPHFLDHKTVFKLKDHKFNGYHHRKGWCYGDLSVGLSLLI